MWTGRQYYVMLEQQRQMDIHKWIVGVHLGRDPGQDAFLDWIQSHAADFRKWAESIPYECLGCGHQCPVSCGKECIKPFDEERINFWLSSIKSPEQLRDS